MYYYCTLLSQILTYHPLKQLGEFDRLNFILTTYVATSLRQFQRLDVETGCKTPTLPPPYTFLHKEYLPKHLQMQHVSNKFINLN